MYSTSTCLTLVVLFKIMQKESMMPSSIGRLRLDEPQGKSPSPSDAKTSSAEQTGERKLL